MNIESNDVHLMLFKICIHKVNLSVRFPCSLTFQIKSQNKTIDSKGNYELAKGSCTPQQTLRIQVQMQRKDDGSYRDKQIKIIIYMTSANGKIPAGSLNVNIASAKQAVSETCTSAIEKCPDKSASLYYTYSLDYLRSIARPSSNTKTNSFYSKLDQSQHSSASRIRSTTNSPSYPNLRSPTERFGNSNKPTLQRRGSNHISSANYQLITKNGQDNQQFDKRSKGSVIVVEDDDLIRKFVDQEKMKTSQMKQISKIQRQISRRQFEEKNVQQELYLKVKQQLSEVIAQNQILKERVKGFERKDKQQVQTIKQLKQQIERKRQKGYQIEFSRMENQSIMQEKQKIKKQMQAQLKLYEQEISDLKININTQQKRIQLKQISLKDQLNKLNQKYTQSQIERQKAVMDLNLMLEQLQNNEKKNQITIKQKDRVYAEQKNKLMKKNQNLQRNIDQQKDMIDQKLTNISDLQRQIKSLQGKLDDLHAQGSELKIEGKKIGSDLDKQKQRTKNLLQQKQRLQQAYSQFQKLKKQYQQLSLQQQTTRKNLQNANKNNQQLQTKIKDCQQNIVSKAQQISALSTKIHNLNSQVQTLKKQQQNNNREAENLTMNNLAAANKIQQLRSKLDQLQMSYNEMESQSQQQISYMIKSKQYLQSQLEQTKWNCQKFKQNYEDMSAKCKTLSNDILQLNRRLLGGEQRQTKLQQQISDLKAAIAIVNQQKQLLISKQRELQDKVKQKSDEIYELNKKISKMESENFMILQKQKHTQNFYMQKLTYQQGTNKNKQSKLTQAIENINKLQMQLIAKSEQNNALQTTIARLNNDNQYTKQQLKNTKKEMSELEDQYCQINEEHTLALQKNILALSELQKQKKAKQQLNKTIAQNSKDIEKYKTNTINAVQQLLQELGKDINLSNGNYEVNLISFPDERLSTLQVEAVKKKNNLLIKYQQQIKTQLTHVKNLQDELVSAKRNHSQRQEQLQNLLEFEKTKLKNTHSDLTLQKQQLIQKINLLEDRVFELTSENEKVNIQNEQNKNQIEQHEHHILQLKSQLQASHSQMKKHQDTIKKLQEEHSKVKNNFENSLLNANAQNSTQVDKYKKFIAEYEKKISNFQKVVAQKDESVKKLQLNLETISHQKIKIQQKFQQLTNRYNQLVQQRKSGLENERNGEKNIKKLQQIIANLQSQKQKTNKKLSQSLIEKKKVQDALSEQQIIKNKLMAELQVVTQHAKQLDSILKDTGDKSKKSGQKNAQQIKKLKQEIIQLNSQIQIKTFEQNQSLITIKSLKGANQQLTQQINAKKSELIEIQTKLQQAKNTIILNTQQIQATQAEKESLQNQVRVLKQSAINLQAILDQNHVSQEAITMKQKQIAKLKQQMLNKQRAYQKNIQDVKSQLSETKKDVSSRVQKQDQLKRKIRDLQSTIQRQIYDIDSDKKTWEENAQNQKKKLQYELEGVKEQNKLLAEEFQFQRQQMNHQLDQATEEIATLKQALNEKEFQMSNTNASSAEQLQKIRRLQQQLKECKDEWQKQKLSYVPTKKHLKQIEDQISRYQKYAVQLQKKNKQLTELAKKRLMQQPKSSCGQLLREVNTILLRNKTKILSRCGEREREQVILDFKLIHQKLEGAIKSYHLLK